MEDERGTVEVLVMIKMTIIMTMTMTINITTTKTTTTKPNPTNNSGKNENREKSNEKKKFTSLSTTTTPKSSKKSTPPAAEKASISSKNTKSNPGDFTAIATPTTISIPTPFPKKGHDWIFRICSILNDIFIRFLPIEKRRRIIFGYCTSIDTRD